MATRLLLLLLLAMSTVDRAGAAAAAGGSPSWCVCRPDAPRAALQSTLDYACGNGAACAPLHAGAHCHRPDTLVAHCSYAANSYYFHRKAKDNDGATCDFGGAATLTEINPSSRNCTYPATAAASATDDGATAASKAVPWCVCKPDLSNATLQQTLDYACGHGADCDALHPGGKCHVPSTLLAYCSYAANSYFQSNKDAACDFAGAAALSYTDPSSGTCKYPATEHATSPATWKMLLCFFLIGLTVCVFYIVILSRTCGVLCSVDCPRGSSTRAMVSAGLAVDEESGTAAVAEAEAESPVTSTCAVCFEAWTNQGSHRICCIPCGHVYGRSCLERWLMQHGNSGAKCPKCVQTFQLRDIINLYGPEEASQS